MSWIDDADERGAWREYLEICRRKYDEAVGDISNDALTVLDAYEKLREEYARLEPRCDSDEVMFEQYEIECWRLQEENARIELCRDEERNLRYKLIIELSVLRGKVETLTAFLATKGRYMDELIEEHFK